MTYTEVIALVTAIIGSGGLTKIWIDLRKFRKEQKKAEASTKEVIEDVKQDVEDMRSVMEFKNYMTAFQELQDIVEKEINKLELENKEPRMKLKHLAVSMYYSWENFIDLSIKEILSKYPKAIIELNVVFVDFEFLKKLNVSNSNQNWAAKSEQREEECLRFSKFSKKKFSNRLIFQAKTYSNLPHWHGWLVNDEHLLLGRTKWDIDNGKFILKVGQNEYRYFHLSNIVDGKGRVEIFKQWFDYYFEFACTKKLVNCDKWVKCAN